MENKEPMSSKQKQANDYARKFEGTQPLEADEPGQEDAETEKEFSPPNSKPEVDPGRSTTPPESLPPTPRMSDPNVNQPNLGA